MSSAFERNTLVCDGHCDKMHSDGHQGEVRPVHITCKNTGHDWGWFNYCETAREMDRGTGLIVEERSHD